MSGPLGGTHRFCAMPDAVLGAGQGPSRTFTFVFSDESVDRYGDVIFARGWQLENFNTNPIALFGHDAGTVGNVIGRAKNVRVEGSRLIGDIEFMGAEVNPNAEAVYQMVKGGFLKTVSVGFQPIEWELAKDKSRPQGVNFKKQELLEISIVPIPANASALVQAKAAGIAIERLGFSARGATSAGAVHFKQDPSMTARSAAASDPYDTQAIEDRRRKAHAAAVGQGRPNIFESKGHFLQAVAMGGHTIDPRLVRAPTGAGEVDPTGGGFIVPLEYATELKASMYEDAVLAPLCDRRETDRPVSCCRFRGHRDKVFDEAGGFRWKGVSSAVSSRLRRFGLFVSAA